MPGKIKKSSPVKHGIILVLVLFLVSASLILLQAYRSVH
jgi:hypothetical protein